MGVFRCFTEKRQGFDVEAKTLLGDVCGYLGIVSADSVRVLSRYDVEGVSEGTFKGALETVFSEPQTDDHYIDTYPTAEYTHRSFAVEALPGQYDQRADACAQCLLLLSLSDTENAGVSLPLVKTAKVYILGGSISDAELERIKRYIINAVDSREASDEKPVTLAAEKREADTVPTLTGFIGAGDTALREYLSEYGLAMDFADLCFLRDYFRDTERRDPTLAELRVIDTYWSDHCRHTTFNTHLTNINIENEDVKAAYDDYLASRRELYGAEAEKRPQTLMDIATIAAKTLRSRGLLNNMDISDEVNACSIKIEAEVDGKTEDWLLMFKNETHNHPTEIEPFGGAATCLGGAIRDPLSGRAYVYQAMRITGSGDPCTPLEDTLPGKLPQRKLTLTAARGYSSYRSEERRVRKECRSRWSPYH